MACKEKADIGELKAHARREDPDTSYDAAASLKPETLSTLQTLVLNWFLVHGSATDEELTAQFSGYGESTIRSRRAALVALGILADSGERRVNSRGRKTIVWVVKGDVK